MKRMLYSVWAVTLTAAIGSGPAAAQIPSTPAAIQDNVRHIKNVTGTTGGHVVVEGDRLYMGNYGIGMSIYDISDPTDPTLLGTYRPQRGVADAVPDAAHYEERKIAVLGGTNRAPGTQTTDFLDVTNPASPTVLHTYTGANDGESHNTDIVDERKLYLPSGGRSGDMLRIYDISPLLQTPATAPRPLFRGNLNTMWVNSPYRAKLGRTSGVQPSHVHDLQVYTDFNLLLLPDEWVDQDGDDIPDPTYAKRDIVLLAASQDYPTTVGIGGAQTTPNNSAVYIADITNPAAPFIVNKIQTRPGHRYLHEVQLLEGDQSIMFTSDEDLHNGCDAGGVWSWRLSEDLTEATFLDSWFNGTGTPAPLCSAHVFSSHGDYVFMGSYNAGLQVIDFTDPADLKRGGQYIVEGANSWGATYHAGYIYTGDFGARGLDVFEFIQEPTAKAFLKAGNPTSRTAAIGGGVSEVVGACDPEAPTNDIDGMLVQVPADKADGTHMFRAMGSSGAPYDVDTYFWDKDCSYLGGILEDVPEMSGDAEGLIPEQAAFAYVDLFAGTPQWVYARIT